VSGVSRSPAEPCKIENGGVSKSRYEKRDAESIDRACARDDNYRRSFSRFTRRGKNISRPPTFPPNDFPASRTYRRYFARRKKICQRNLSRADSQMLSTTRERGRERERKEANKFALFHASRALPRKVSRARARICSPEYRVGRYGTMLLFRSYRFARACTASATAMEVMKKSAGRVIMAKFGFTRRGERVTVYFARRSAPLRRARRADVLTSKLTRETSPP